MYISLQKPVPEYFENVLIFVECQTFARMSLWRHMSLEWNFWSFSIQNLGPTIRRENSATRCSSLLNNRAQNTSTRLDSEYCTVTKICFDIYFISNEDQNELLIMLKSKIGLWTKTNNLCDETHISIPKSNPNHGDFFAICWRAQKKAPTLYDNGFLIIIQVFPQSKLDLHVCQNILVI